MAETRSDGVRLALTSASVVPAVVALALLVLPAAGVAQTRMVVSGRAWGGDGAPVEDATVRLIPAEGMARVRTVGTDALGYFALRDVAPGAYTLEVERIGYAEHVRPVHVGSSDVELEITLPTVAVALPGVSVEAERGRLRARFEDAAGRTAYEIAGTDLKAVPSLVEADPIRAVEVLPGVNTVSDFSAAFNVRGGSADQNLILLDKVPIFNPFHLGGFFSVFNADMVRRAELRSGGFSPEYGGRVSSVLLVESDHGDGRLGADLGVSLLASRIAVKGTLPAGLAASMGLVNSRWRMSARRSYADVVLRSWADVPYHLVDYQGVFEAWTSGGSRIRLTAYHGKDDVDMGESFRTGTPSAGREDDDPPRLLWDWGNTAVGASWTNPMAGGGHLDVHASWTEFRSNMFFPDFRDRPRFATEVKQMNVGIDLEHRPTPRILWKTGVAAVRPQYSNHLPERCRCAHCQLLGSNDRLCGGEAPGLVPRPRLPRQPLLEEERWCIVLSATSVGGSVRSWRNAGADRAHLGQPNADRLQPSAWDLRLAGRCAGRRSVSATTRRTLQAGLDAGRPCLGLPAGVGDGGSRH